MFLDVFTFPGINVIFCISLLNLFFCNFANKDYKNSVQVHESF